MAFSLESCPCQLMISSILFSFAYFFKFGVIAPSPTISMTILFLFLIFEIASNAMLTALPALMLPIIIRWNLVQLINLSVFKCIL